MVARWACAPANGFVAVQIAFYQAALFNSRRGISGRIWEKECSRDLQLSNGGLRRFHSDSHFDYTRTVVAM